MRDRSMNQWTSIGAATLLAIFALPAGCGSSGSSAGQCTPGQSVSCGATSGCTGAQVCNPDGKAFGPCTCGGGSESDSGSSGGSGGSGSGSGFSSSGDTDGSSDELDGAT